MFKLLGFTLGGVVALATLYIVAVKSTPDEIKELADESGVISTIEDVSQSALSLGNEFVQDSQALLEELNQATQNQPNTNQSNDEDMSDTLNSENEFITIPEVSNSPTEELSNKHELISEVTPRWEVFWTFDYEYSADQFSKHLAKLTGLELDVFPSKETSFDVAYKYATEEDRQQAVQLIEEHGSIKLAKKLPLSVAIND